MVRAETEVQSVCTHLLMHFWASAHDRCQLLFLGLARWGASSHHLEMVLSMFVEIVRRAC